MPGSRCVGWPLSCASGTARRARRRRASRAARRPARATAASRRSTASVAAVARPTAPATSSVPERTSRSWPPPCSSGTHADVAAQQQRAGADRAAELVPGHGQRVDPGGGEVDRHAADGLHRVGVHRDAVLVGDRGELGDRLHRADLVVGPHDADERDRVRVVGERRAQRRRRRPGRSASTGSQVTSAPSCAASQSTASRTAWCSIGAGDDPAAARVGVAAGPVDALDREVVGLGAAGGEDRPRTGGRPARRRAARGTPRRGGGRRGRPRAATRGCRRCTHRLA